MDAPVNVPIDNPNADTEWQLSPPAPLTFTDSESRNDILRKHGIIPEKPPSPTPIIRAALEEARKQAHDDRLEGKDLDELNELEDEEDEAFLEKYRTRRLAELSTIAATSTFNQVFFIQKPDYPRDVTEASQKAFVCVHLTSSMGGNAESQLLTEVWRELARNFGEIKFCEIRGAMCIENYPEKNTPTILIYRNGDIRKQIVTLRGLRGEQTSVEDLQRLLIEVGAINANDIRIRRHQEIQAGSPKRGLHSSKPFQVKSDSDDDDWD